MDIGERIKYFRKKEGISQRELARKADMFYGSIYQYESGKRTPQREYLQKIAEALNIDIRVLLDLPIETDVETEDTWRNCFVRGYAHQKEQFTYFNDLERFRRKIDSIKDDKIREEAATEFKNLIKAFTDYQKTTEGVDNPKERLKIRQKTLMNILNSSEILLTIIDRDEEEREE